jgi:hypothetical protein
MTDFINNSFAVLILGAGLCIFWGASAGAVYWDLRRSRSSNGELAAWVALALLIPVVGAVAYLTWRLIGTYLTPPNPETLPAGRKRRVTSVQRPEGLPPRKSTIPAADLLRKTLPGLAPEPPAPQPGILTLRIDSGPHAAQTVTLRRMPASIGRGAGAVVRLDEDLGVSRRHAEFYLQAGTLRIRDLGSTHGTLVNGFSISDKGLEPGDRIRVGMTEMILEGKDRYGEAND